MPPAGGALRATPARVGRRRCLLEDNPWTQGNPRAGGQEGRGGRNPAAQRGQPPRGWAGAWKTSRGPKILWATPARVGRSLTKTVKITISPGNPRAGGQEVQPALRRLRGSGQPPRGWAGAPRRAFFHVRGGATPARVGRRESFCPVQTIARGNPRAGGQEHAVEVAEGVAMGQPPRGWAGASPCG